MGQTFLNIFLVDSAAAACLAVDSGVSGRGDLKEERTLFIT